MIAPLILDPHLQGLPFKKGTSGMKNPVTSSPERALSVISRPSKRCFFTRLTLLADRVLLEAFPPFKDPRERWLRRTGEAYRGSGRDLPRRPLADPPDTEAIYLSPSAASAWR